MNITLPRFFFHSFGLTLHIFLSSLLAFLLLMLQCEALPILFTFSRRWKVHVAESNDKKYPSHFFQAVNYNSYCYFQDCMVIFTSADLVANGNQFVEFFFFFDP